MSESPPRLRALRPRQKQRKKLKLEVGLDDQKEIQLLEESATATTGASPGTEPTTVANSEEEEKDDSEATDSANEGSESNDDDDEDESIHQLHERGKRSGLKHECRICKPSRNLSSLKEYMEHLRKEHKQEVRRHKCPNCTYVCRHIKKLQRHVRLFHKDAQEKKDSNGSKNGTGTGTREPTAIVGTVTGGKEKKERIRCNMCSHVAENGRDLEQHQRLHHLKRRFFRCAKCSYVTHVRARYTKHVKYHSMPMIKCDSCDFRTPYKWNLDRHTRNHGGNGAFQCKACNFTADIRQSLTVHETNHHEPPVVQSCRKSTPFERKPRNFPKRYNQVGASDFRDTTSPISGSPSKSTLSDADEEQQRRNALSVGAADCIALKCEEKGCQFITAWDSEMQRHLVECHLSPPQASKSKKPLPMLIPLGSSSSPSNVSSPSTLLKVPKVRVRPELAQIARVTEIAKLYGSSKESAVTVKKEPPGDFEKKNASFFDKLKEKLNSSSSSSTSPSTSQQLTNGLPDTQVSQDLKCWCTFEAATPEALNLHKQTHHTALSVSIGATRCPKCRRRCKTSSDLQAHMKFCQANAATETSTELVPARGDFLQARNEFQFQQGSIDWEGASGSFNSSGSSVEANAGSSFPGRRVFKCPHCPFWASTASRFHVHIVGHLNRKPFECSLCSYRSNWRWDITKHIKLKAAKDPVHLTARVLMTDETGRRNYSKYNKYLAQIESLENIDDKIEMEAEGAEEEVEDEEDVVQESDDQQEDEGILSRPPQSSSSPIPASTSASGSASATTGGSKSGNGPIRAQGGQSLLKNTNPLTIVPVGSTEESKKTLWKCKRCNFRAHSKQTVLVHVKSHYEAPECDKNGLDCDDCPFNAEDSATLAKHRQHHLPNLEAIFKCYLCPYYVNTKAELLDHTKLHGEELAVVHQRNVESDFRAKSGLSGNGRSMNDDDDSCVERVVQLDSSPKNTLDSPPPLLLDTRSLPDPPLVWVSRLDGSLVKMLKCRHCPYVSSRRIAVREHENMHLNSPGQRPIACPSCSFSCARKDVMEAHADMHSGSLGTVHCLVDESRSDAQQIADLTSLLGLSTSPVLGTEPDLRDSRLVHCCGKCPARFLCEKELRIHLRYHSTELAYYCPYCKYAARHPAHLLAHQKAHSTEYQERTVYLLSLYGHSQRYPPPSTMSLETGSSSGSSDAVWVVVDQQHPPRGDQNPLLRGVPRNQVFTCAKCPARYFKLDALEYHMTLHGSNNRYRCTDCDYSSKTMQNLLKHQVVHRRIEQNQNPNQNQNQESDHQDRLQIVSEERSPSLDLEDQGHRPEFDFLRGNPNFVYPGYIRNGRLREKRYKCHKCPSAFEKREQYRVHLTLHGAKQRYRCDTCDYSVKYYSNYVQHTKKHQANAEAQASKRRFESEVDPVDQESVVPENAVPLVQGRTGKTLKTPVPSSTMTPNSNSNLTSTSTPVSNLSLTSNQDKQSLLLLERKGLLVSPELELESLRCQNCPFSTLDKDLLDAHRRRHGIERLSTPSCPHCDYVPRKDENVGEHVQLHFNRMYKPDSYLIIELLSLTVRQISPNGKIEKKELLFRECEGQRFLPQLREDELQQQQQQHGGAGVGAGGGGGRCHDNRDRVIVDPNTGETKQRVVSA